MRRVRVGDVVKLQRRSVEIDPVESYTLVGVYSFGRGIFHREPQLGAELGNYRFFAVEPGDLVLSNIQAWEGAIAHATEKDRGCIGTHRFLTYVPTGDHVDTNYLHYYFLSESGHALIQQAAPGSVTRNRTLAIDRFEELVIPLPDVDEQRHIAARLDRVHQLIEVAREQTARGNKAGEALRWSILRSEFDRLEKRWGRVAVTDAVDINPESVKPESDFPGGEFVYVDIGSIRNGTGEITNAQPTLAADAPSRARRRIRSGDVLVSTVRPNLRGVGLVTPQLDGQVCSTGFAVLRPREGVDSRFLLLQMLSDVAVDQLVRATRGGHYPAVNDSSLRTVELVMPELDEQRETVDRLERIFSSTLQLLQRLQRQSAELEALRISSLNAAFSVEQ